MEPVASAGKLVCDDRAGKSGTNDGDASEAQRRIPSVNTASGERNRRQAACRFPVRCGLFACLFLVQARELPAQAPVASADRCSVEAERVVTSPGQRVAAGRRIKPPLPEGPTEFDWPDTELGIVRSRNGKDYIFFASDGGCHSHCNTPGALTGSITRTVGSLDEPLRPHSPVTESFLPRNRQVSGNAIVYLGGGPVFRVPTGHPGAGNLLLVYQAARNSDPKAHTGMHCYLGIAMSTDEGASWKDLGLFIDANLRFDPAAPGATNEYDIGDGNLVPDPSGTYLYLYFPDKIPPALPGGPSLNTYFSVARVPMDEFLSAILPTAARASGSQLPPFQKYYRGRWSEPGWGGRSSMLLPGPWPSYAGSPFVAYSDYLHAYVAILDDTKSISYALSEDGIHWSMPTLLVSFSAAPALAEYAVAAGTGADPQRLGERFYVYFTYYPTDGTGWHAATLRRLTVSCHS